MQERKKLESAIEQDRQLGALISDIDTLIELGNEGEDVSADL